MLNVELLFRICNKINFIIYKREILSVGKLRNWLKVAQQKKSHEKTVTKMKNQTQNKERIISQNDDTISNIRNIMDLY